MQQRRSHPCRTTVCVIVGLAGLSGFPASADDQQPEPWKAPAWASAKKNPVVADAASIVAGKAVYAANCLACHGTTGKGNGPAAIALNPKPEDLATAKIMDQTDGAMFWRLTEGRAPMPSYRQQLSETQRWQVVNYVRSLGPTPPTLAAPEDLRGAVSSVFRAYQTIHASLAKKDAAGAAGSAHSLVEAAAKLVTADTSGLDAPNREVWLTDAKLVAAAAASLKDTGAAPTPEAFQKLSDLLTTMIAVFGHHEATPVRVFVTSNDAKVPALWLQTATEPADPYAGDPSPGAAVLQRQLASERPKQ